MSWTSSPNSGLSTSSSGKRLAAEWKSRAAGGDAGCGWVEMSIRRYFVEVGGRYMRSCAGPISSTGRAIAALRGHLTAGRRRLLDILGADLGRHGGDLLPAARLGCVTPRSFQVAGRDLEAMRGSSPWDVASPRSAISRSSSPALACASMRTAAASLVAASASQTTWHGPPDRRPACRTRLVRVAAEAVALLVACADAGWRCHRWRPLRAAGLGGAVGWMRPGDLVEQASMRDRGHFLTHRYFDIDAPLERAAIAG
jgi:hypothetical protein